MERHHQEGGREGVGRGSAVRVNTEGTTSTTGRQRSENKILKCITLNAQSLVNKMEEFKIIVKNTRPHVISITESWGQEWHTDGVFSLDGFTMYRNDRKDIRGGGTLLYIKNNIEQRGCRSLNEHNYENSALCWVVGKGNKKNLVVR